MMPKKVLYSTKNVFSEFDIKEGIFNKHSIERSELSECATLISGAVYKSVKLYFLDMSSGSATGTFKDWVACATIAYCKKNEIPEFVTQSSGNTANAIAKYCQSHKIKTNIFYLKENKHKIKPQFYQNKKFIKTHEVSSSGAQMKILTSEFSKKKNVPWLPDLKIQIGSNSFRADVIHKITSMYGIRFDWVSQSLSSAYGVLGFYDGLRRLKISSISGYRFLGIQQTAVCPFVRKFDPAQCATIDSNKEPIIEKTLFRSKPTEELYKLMERILDEYGGGFTLVSKCLYDEVLPFAIKLLYESGIIIAKDSFGDYFEKSGIINLVGVLNAIDNGIIKEGQSVLAAITGGCDSGPKGTLIPDYTY